MPFNACAPPYLYNDTPAAPTDDIQPFPLPSTSRGPNVGSGGKETLHSPTSDTADLVFDLHDFIVDPEPPAPVPRRVLGPQYSRMSILCICTTAVSTLSVHLVRMRMQFETVRCIALLGPIPNVTPVRRASNLRHSNTQACQEQSHEHIP